MRKQSTYRPKRTSPPMLINRGLINDRLETRERMIAAAFSGGWAGEVRKLAEKRTQGW